MRVYIVMSYDTLTLDDHIHEVFAEEHRAEAYASSLNWEKNDDTIEFYVRDMEVR